MRLIEKIKKFFELPKQCSTCKYWEHRYNHVGDCRVYNDPADHIRDYDHICSLYERKKK